MKKLYKQLLSVCMLVWLTTSFTFAQQTYYTIKSGGTLNWNDNASWTFDPNSVNGGAGIPGEHDNIYIHTGVTLKVPADLSIVNYGTIDISIGGTLKFENEKQLNFTSINGAGNIEINNTKLPKASSHSTQLFSDSSKGYIIFYGSNNLSIKNKVGYMFSNLIKKGNGQLEIGKNNFQDFTIEEGTVVLPFYTRAIVKGDIIIKPGTFFLTDDDSDKNKDSALETYGNFTNEGTVDIKNCKYYLYGENDQQVVLSTENGGTVDLERIVIEKNSKSDKVSFTSYQNDILTLHGVNNGKFSGTEGVLEGKFSFALEKGTAIIGENIQLNLGNGDGNRPLRSESILHIDGGTIENDNKFALTVYGQFKITKGNYTSLGSEGITLRERGEVVINGGLVNIKKMKTSNQGEDHQGSYTQTGGILNIKGFDDKYQPFSLPYSSNVFNMSSGGLIIIDGTDSNSDKGLLIRSSDGNSKVTGGEIRLITKDKQKLVVASQPYLPTLNVTGDGEVEVSPLSFDGEAPTQYPLRIEKDLKIAAELYVGTQDVIIGEQLHILKKDAYRYKSNANREIRVNNNRTIFSGDRKGSIFIDYPAYKENSTSEEVNLYHVVVDKSGAVGQDSVVLFASDHVKATKMLADYIDGDKDEENECNLLRIGDTDSDNVDVGTLEVKRGILHQNEYSIRLFCNTFIGKDGQLGVFDAEKTSSNAIVKFRPKNQVINVEKGAKIGNVKINAENNTIAFDDDIYIQRIYYKHGLVDLRENNMKVDRFDLRSDLGYDGLNKNFFITNGNDSDGGLSILVHDGMYHRTDSKNIIIDLPIGTSSTNYSPLKLLLESNTTDLNTINDYITVKAVNKKLATAKPGSDNEDMLPLYWKVTRGNDKMLPQMILNGYIQTNYTIESDWEAGKVLDSDQIIADIYKVANYERKSTPNKITEDLKGSNDLYLYKKDYFMHRVVFDGRWDNDNTKEYTELENANYTIGVEQSFVGSPEVFYWTFKGNGVGNAAARWDNADNWVDVNGKGIYDPTGKIRWYPIKNDIAVFDKSFVNNPTTQLNDIRVPNYFLGNDGKEDKTKPFVAEVAEVVFADPDPEFRVIVHDIGTLKARNVKGPGQIIVHYGVTEYGHLEGDFGAWAKEDSSVFNARVANSVATDDIAIIRDQDAIKSYPKFYVNAEGANRFARLDFDLSATEFRVINKAKVLIDGAVEKGGNMNIKNDIYVGNYAKGQLMFYGGQFEKEIKARNIFIGNPNNNDGAKIITSDNSYTGKTEHKFFLRGGILLTKTKNGLNNINVSLIDNNTSVKTYFEGTDRGFIDSYITEKNPIKMGDIVINKDFVTDSVFFNADIEFVQNRVAPNNEKSFVLNSGTVILNNPLQVLDVNAGGGNFEIAKEAKLIIQNGAKVVTTSDHETGGGVDLHGGLFVKGGTADFSGGLNGNTPVIYSSNATIYIENTDSNQSKLLIGAQLRTPFNTQKGILNYVHKSGVVEIGGQTLKGENLHQAVLELNDIESVFNLGFKYEKGVNELIIRGGNNTDRVLIDIFNLTPNNNTFAHDAKIVIETEETAPVKIYAKDLPYLFINKGKIELDERATNTNIHYGLEINNLDAQFNQKGKGLTLINPYKIVNNNIWSTEGGNLTIIGDDHVVYSGANSTHEAINNLVISVPSIKFDQPFTSNSLQVKGNLDIQDQSEVILKGTDLLFDGNLLSLDGKISSNTKTEKISFNKGSEQFIKANNGHIDFLSMNNDVTLYDADQSSSFFKLTLQEKLEILNGVLYIQENQLWLGRNLEISSGTNSFDETRMIATSGNQRDGGIVKAFKGTIDGNTIPLGVITGSDRKYTPLSFTALSGHEKVDPDASFNINVAILNQVYPGLKVEGQPDGYIHSLLDYTWFINSIDDNGDILQLPDHFNLAVNMTYDQGDVITNAPITEDDYLTAEFFENALNWQVGKGGIDINNNYIQFILSGNVMKVLNNNVISGVYSAGHRDDMSIGITEYYTVADGDWSNHTIWETYPLKEGNKIIIDGEEYPTYVKGDPEPSSHAPSNGTNITINSGHVVNYNTPGLFLSKMQLDGHLKLSQAGAQGGFGFVYGNGTIELNKTLALPDGNWDDFMKSDAQGGIVMMNLDPNMYGIGTIDYKDGVNVNLGSYQHIRGLQFSNADISKSLVMYNLNYSNITIGDAGFTIGDNARVNMGGTDQTVFTINGETNIDGHLSLTNGPKAYFNKDLNVNTTGHLQLEGELYLSEDFNVTSGGTISHSSTSLTVFNGVDLQSLSLAGQSLRSIQVAMSGSTPILNVVSESTVDNQILFTTGKIKSSGNLIVNNPEGVFNSSDVSYIIGETYFKLGQTFNADIIIFPIGSDKYFYPIAVGTRTDGAGLGKDVMFKADFTADIIDEDVNVNVPDIVDSNGHKLTAIQKDGTWILEPQDLKVGEQIELYVWKYIGRIKNEYGSALDDHETDFRNVFIDDASEYHVIGGNVNEVHVSRNGIKPNSTIYFIGQGVGKKATISIASASSSARTTSTEYSNAGFQWGYVGHVFDKDLPVELISFDAEVTDQEQVFLSWSTAQEQNNEVFVIEKSSNNRDWEYLGEVEGKGNTNVRTDYFFKDKSPFKGQSYYRLIQYDFNGDFEVFGPVKVSMNTEEEALEVNVYPNPAYGETVTLEFLTEADKYFVEVLNASGRRVYFNESDHFRHEINISQFTSGMYFIRVTEGSRQIIKKLICK
ncbi:T9SS type A sorting domain-containing protein [Flammeovirga sp. SubArs3]|uniref:T9SS type A sorting domain-containing protein n=1 Tax=Flammeovirga sp. SubArs3 TaxID=2995316 RepID=UPI00248B21A5|nr:T9SS type A sorting domain-containing protein [Flammeovirga sp. SubArs3]